MEGWESVQFSRSVVSNPMDPMFATPWTAAHQTSLSIINSQSLVKLRSIKSVMPSNNPSLCLPFLLLLSSLCLPFLLLPPPKNQGLFQGVSSLHQVTNVLEFQLQHQSFLPMNIQDLYPLGLTGWISLQIRRLSTQLKSINSSVLIFLYSSTLTSIHDYWKNHSFDWMDLGQQSNISAF